MGAVLFSAWLASRYSKTVERNLPIIVYFCFYIATAHFMVLLVRNDFSTEYLLGAYVTILAVSTIFYTRGALFIYAIFSLITLALLVTFFHGSGISKVIVLSGLATVFAPAFVVTGQRNQTERALRDGAIRMRENEKFLSAILDNLPVGLACKDLKEDLRYIFWNRKNQEIFGHGKEVLGKNCRDLLPSDEADRIYQADLDTIRSGHEVRIMETREVSRFHDSLTLLVYKIPLKDSTGEFRFLIEITENVTERKKAEEQVTQQQVMLASSAKMSALGEMAAGIAHEVNSPLAVICMIVGQMREFIQDKAYDEKPFLLKSLATLETTALRISKTIGGLKVFSRDGQDDPFVFVKVNTIVEDTLIFCQEKFKTRSVEIHVDRAPEDLSVECRPVQISQVLLNLLNNAVDAIESLPERWVKIEIKTVGDSIQIAVVDSGNGIPPEVQAKLMKPFFTTKGVGKGTGLGLNISKGIMESNKGRLYLDSQSSHTRFVMALPIEKKSLEKAA